MTQDEIIEMARQAEIIHPEMVIKHLEAFAKLVEERTAAKEREACAKVCEEGIANAEDWDSTHWDQACENRAWAIRARAQADRGEE